MKLEAGKVAVVTGTASGIGLALALAERFAHDGLNVVLADVEEAALASAAERIGALGVETLAVPTDVGDNETVEALAGAAVDRFGSVRVVCNNAGVNSRADPWFGPLSAWDWVLGVNLWGVIHGPAAIADVVAEAIVSDRFWILPHPEFVEWAARRWQRIAEGLDPDTAVDVPGFPPTEQWVSEIRAAPAAPTG